MFKTAHPQPYNQTIGPELQTIIAIPERVSAVPLSQCELSVRLQNVLRKLNCERLGDLHGWTFAQVLTVPACGIKTIRELENFIAKLHGGKTQLRAMGKLHHNPQKQQDRAVLFIPQHARGWTLKQLPLSPRLANVLKNMGFQLLGDLHSLSLEQVRKAKNCGRHSVAELGTFVRRVQAGEFDQIELEDKEHGLRQLIRFVEKEIAAISPRDRAIMLLRFGGSGETPQTLEEIGHSHGLTRERIRQIERRVLERLRQHGGPQLHERLNVLTEECLSAVCPLTPQLLAQWLGPEASDCHFPLAFYLRLLGEFSTELPVWPEGQRETGASTPRAAEILRQLKNLLCQSVSALSLAEAFKQLQMTGLPRRLSASEMLKALRRNTSLLVDFTTPDQPMLRPTKLKTRDWARMILARAEVPLVTEQMIERARIHFGDDFTTATPRSLENVLKPEYGFYLLAPRAYGLRQHFRLPQHLWKSVRADFYGLLRNEKRPTSTTEVINEHRFDWVELTNAYELAQVLREDKRFVDLGRFLFALEDWGVEEREHIVDLLPRVFEEVGRPMALDQVADALLRFRSASLTSLAAILRKHSAIRDYFGYYGLRSWGESVREFLVEEKVLVNRVVRRAEPPLTFGRLCQILEVPDEGLLADRLWRTTRSLSKVSVRPKMQAAETLLTHSAWSIERALYTLLAQADCPLPAFEIQWAFNERYKPAFGMKSLAELEQCLQHSRLFVRTATGEYMLHDRIHSSLDAAEIRQSSFELLSASNEIAGADDLLARLEAAGVEVTDLSPDMLAAILRSEDIFDEVGRNRFRVKQ